MKIASNKVTDVIRFFQEELTPLYEKEELKSIIAYCLEVWLGIKRAEIGWRTQETMSESDLLKFNGAIKALKKHKPIQYILGEADFYCLKFKVNEQVLIPRPETEELVDLIVKDYDKIDTLCKKPVILDIGTGSGCIAIALKKNIPSAKVYAFDISESALEVAKFNAVLNNVEIEFVLADILNPLSIDQFKAYSFDIIVSNPPYICDAEKKNMQKNVLDYEPPLALFVNDSDPLLFYKSITDFSLSTLKPTGKMYLEINQQLALESKHLLVDRGFINVELIKDLNMNYRILRGNR